ncbi:hypothetical protein ZYGR_0AK01290 [Zygosaccharomyces rouxii]|uniref:ZYRO0D03190p n=2 Tax=Zygosaccharomyces rouxii TaxID=4956 RepID=C5DV19_ZYGRC|nr:uncharacterized protein ZYRO0D03190g [Zygosaccharomyces rouxii]KAH9200552.1 PAP2 superfamily-domain-containing protein [Zygosaccharomyces rouxii]GAV48716.1 hypothetical protein ZYGR_0N01200 [Zygosaccharomyces rouxii]GAV53627.1 hypothetical protein ZYGR_0AK01290 [Zygosaccharomyces rouxii]CAR27638.1 ZYRO0D03190p [Zygosaccharomyces rouxii]
MTAGKKSVLGLEPNDTLKRHPLKDPGNHGPEHFRGKMSHFRFATRQYLTRYTNSQSEYLAKWQSRYKTKWNSVYFATTALFAAHTFYIICLPTPAWAGAIDGISDMVYILAYSIYLSGFLKDFWCLPRPKSPPLHRITLSEYTTREYGAPSSHCANATAASLYLMWNVAGSNTSITNKAILFILIIAYYLTLAVGRIYCGMHGLLDVGSGILCGLICTLGRAGANRLLSNFQCGDYWWFPILSITWGLTILLKHVRPIDECPCFSDSVAFVGVVSGLEVTRWTWQRLGIDVTYGMSVEGAPGLFAGRLIVGGLIVVIWKYVLSKPLVYSFLIYVLGMEDDRPIKEEERAKYADSIECPPFIGEAKIDIVGRYVIYGGIPPVVLFACPAAFKLLKLLNVAESS